MSVKEAAIAWSMTPRRVTELCVDGRIPGAERFGNVWAIPKDAIKPNDARVRGDFSPDTKVRPIIKWAGGKGQLLDVIRSSYPQGIGDTITRYAEPFIGGAAVLLDLLSSHKLDDVYISDVNQELVTLYRTVRDRPDELIELLSSYQREHLALGMDGRKELYYQQRSRYNEIKTQAIPDEVRCAALFVYLNKTCFNGLYRVNAKGEFNVPSGVYKNPMICDADNIRNVSELLDGVRIECADYRESSSFIDEDTFVYFDPPYRPITQTSSFTSYTEGQFDDDDQRDLAVFVRELSDRGARVMVSNSDPKNTDPDDDFFDELYSGMEIRRVPATRMINSDAKGRGRINELLITNYPVVPIQRGLEYFERSSHQEPDGAVGQAFRIKWLPEHEQVLVHGEQEPGVRVPVQVPVALAVPFPLDDVLLEDEPLPEEVQHHPGRRGDVVPPVVGVPHQDRAVSVGSQHPTVLRYGPPILPEERHVVVQVGQVPFHPVPGVPNDVHVRGMGRDEIDGPVGYEIQIPGVPHIGPVGGPGEALRHPPRQIQPVPCDGDGIRVDVDADGVPPREEAFHGGGPPADHRIQHGVPGLGVELQDVPDDLGGPVAPVLGGVGCPATPLREAPHGRPLGLEVGRPGRDQFRPLVLPPGHDGLVLNDHGPCRILGDLQHDRCRLASR